MFCFGYLIYIKLDCLFPMICIKENQVRIIFGQAACKSICYFTFNYVYRFSSKCFYSLPRHLRNLNGSFHRDNFIGCGVGEAGDIYSRGSTSFEYGFGLQIIYEFD